MQTTDRPKRRAFAPQKPTRKNENQFEKRTERQRAADKRHRMEAQSRGRDKNSGGLTPEKRMKSMAPGQIRITSLIVDELTRALSVILKLDGPADVLMKLFFRSNPKLGMRERSILAEGIYYSLRHYASIRWAMRPVKPEKAPRLVALLTLARQHGLETLPETSIGSEKKPLENILKANLEKAPAHVRAELPQWLFDLVEAQFDDGEALYPAMCTGAPLDLRVNLLKTTREEVLAQLEEAKVPAMVTPYSPDGIRLPTKPGLTQWPIYKDGLVDVQDEGSQLIARLLTPRRREMVCDFCAGAGGKTLAMGALMRSTGRLYAFDVNEKRLAGLTPRMRRAGLSNVHPVAIVSENDNRVRRLQGKFDRVLIDAPCSGTGTFRRNPDLKWRMSPDELTRINEIQKSVLEHASRLVKDGGRLVYATCSLLKRENQDVVEAFLAIHPEWSLVSAKDVLAQQGITLEEAQWERFGSYFQMLPHINNTDGFFGAVLQKQKPQRHYRPRVETPELALEETQTDVNVQEPVEEAKVPASDVATEVEMSDVTLATTPETPVETSDETPMSETVKSEE